MPRITTNDTAAADDLAQRIAALPREVRVGLATLSPEQQVEYLDSLEKVEQMQARGETIDPEAPYGRKRDGTPKAKPGRRPAENPGARTQERPERFRRDDLDLEQILADLPDDEDTPIPVPADYPSHSDPQPAQVAQDQCEDQAYQAELEAAIQSAGLTLAGREIVSKGEIRGRRKVEPEDPDDLYATATVEEHVYRVTADDTDWHLEELVDGTWRTVSSALDVSGLAMHFAFHRIRVENFGEAIVHLPRYRPRRQAYNDAFAVNARCVPMTAEEKRRAQSETRAEMSRRRARHEREDTANCNWIG